MRMETDVVKYWQLYQTDKSTELKHKIMLAYMWLVKYVIQQMHLPTNSILEDDDFVNIGILGLHEAIERFEPDRGVKFESYAIPRIRGIIQDELRRLDWLSRTARKKASDFLQATDALRSQIGREASEEEIMKKLDVTPEKYQSYLAAAAAAKASMSLSETQIVSTDEEGMDIIEDIADTAQSDFLEMIESDERITFITDYLTTLHERKRQVMSLYYYENLTFKEIGQVLKVSESRICQIHTQVIRDMRKRLFEFDRV